VNDDERERRVNVLRKVWPEHDLNPDCADPLVRFDVCGILGLCGCGNPEGVARLLLRILKSAQVGEETWFDLSDEWRAVGGLGEFDPLLELSFHWIEDHGWVDHGSVIYGSWINERGQAAVCALELLLENFDEE